MKPIDIFLTAYVRKEFTLQTIKYLKERTKTPYRLFLINNGGNEIEDESIFLRLDMNHNIGIHAAWNIALALAESDYFITTDNDILVPDLTHIEFFPSIEHAVTGFIPVEKQEEQPDWLERLAKFMDERSDYGAISLHPHIFIGAGMLDANSPNDVEERNMCGAVMRMCRKDAVIKVGGWERVVRSSRNHEEHILADRLHAIGYKTGITTRLRAFHLFGNENTDPWGYDKNDKPEDHGHREIWPPVNVYGNMAEYDNKTWMKL